MIYALNNFVFGDAILKALLLIQRSATQLSLTSTCAAMLVSRFVTPLFFGMDIVISTIGS
jgi:hypothetical protein